jgi:hypothetical protein
MIEILILEVIFESQPAIFTEIFHKRPNFLGAKAGFFPYTSKFLREEAGKVDLARNKPRLRPSTD